MSAIIKISYHTKVLDTSSTYHSSAAGGAISLLSLLDIFFSFMMQTFFISLFHRKAVHCWSAKGVKSICSQPAASFLLYVNSLTSTAGSWNPRDKEIIPHGIQTGERCR